MNAAITCLEVRRILGAEPQRRDPAVVEHCRTCTGCSAFMKEMLDLDVRLKHALDVDVPEELEANIVFSTAFRPAPKFNYRWLAAAAVLLLVVGLGFGTWRMSLPKNDMLLAEAMVEHVIQQSPALASTTPVAQASVNAVLERVGAKMQGGMGPITYADTFSMHGRMGAHLVMMTPHGAVSLLLMPHVHVKGRMQMDSQGYHCMIDPMGRGSIAIVASTSMSMDGMEQHILSMLQWIS